MYAMRDKPPTFVAPVRFKSLITATSIENLMKAQRTTTAINPSNLDQAESVGLLQKAS
jgi:hypothetical protein